jgi:prephenate dehydratase
VVTVAYQGEPGSYSEEAVWYRFGGHGLRSVGCHSFAEAAGLVAEGKADCAVLPTENTITGPIEDAVAAIKLHGLREADRFWRRVDHCLVGHPEASKERVRRVYSHPMALEQCRSYLLGQGFAPVQAEDTAGAVREVKQRGDASEAAVASRRAAAIHRMVILEATIQDRRDNRTLFVVVRRS